MSVTSPKPDRWAAERAATVARREADTAAWARANPGALDAMASRFARADQARQTWARATPAPPPKRAARPVPTPGRQFAAAAPITALTDPGLTRAAIALLAIIMAQASAHRAYRWDTSKPGLARQLGVAPCTVRRALRQLEERGYIATEILLDGRGRTAGLRLQLLAPAIIARPPAQGGGVQARPHYKDKDIIYRSITLPDWLTLCRQRWRERQPGNR